MFYLRYLLAEVRRASTGSGIPGMREWVAALDGELKGDTRW